MDFLEGSAAMALLDGAIETISQHPWSAFFLLPLLILAYKSPEIIRELLRHSRLRARDAEAKSKHEAELDTRMQKARENDQSLEGMKSDGNIRDNSVNRGQHNNLAPAARD